MAVFRDVAPCSLVDSDQHFKDAYCRHHQGDDHLQDTLFTWKYNSRLNNICTTTPPLLYKHITGV
jgi:hypothetical protein